MIIRASELRAWLLTSAGVLCLSAITYRVMTLPDLRPIATGATAALNTINRPCGQVEESGEGSEYHRRMLPCGTLASVDKVVVKIGDIAVDTQQQVQQSGKLINTTSESLASVAQAAQGAIGTLQGSLTHVAPLLDAARGSIEAVQPVLQHVTADADTISANANGGVTDFRRFITAPALSDTLTNVANVTGSAAGIAADARKISDKETKDFLKPVPWYLWPVKRGGELIDIGAAVARHAP